MFYLGNGQGLLGTPYLLCTSYRVLLFGWCRILCNGQEQLVRTNSLLLLLLLVFYTALQQTKQLPSNVLILVFFIIVFGYFLSLKPADSPPVLTNPAQLLSARWVIKARPMINLDILVFMTLMCGVYLVVKPYFRAVSIPYV